LAPSLARGLSRAREVVLQKVMRPKPLNSFARTVLGTAWALVFLGLPFHVAAQPAEREATGLIIGFKADVLDTPASVKNNGPWVNDRVRAQSTWERSARRGRERMARLAQEAGVPMRRAGEAGGAQWLGFDRPLKGEALGNAMRRMRLHPDVAWVEPDVLVPRLQATTPLVPDDAMFAQQWHLATPGSQALAGLNLPAAWGRSTGSPVVVAVVDSGVRFDHPDLAGRLLPGYDLVSEVEIGNDGDGRDADASDPGDWLTLGESRSTLFASCNPAASSWHGTFIAGQIAAASNNQQGVSGLNWAAQVLPVRVSGKCGARVSDLLDGVRWAAGLPVAGVPSNPNPARIINLSFGGDAPCSAAYQDAINSATDAGALVVVAAGNASMELRRPADCQRVMAVASVQRDGAKASYSSFGHQVALSAPGGSFSWGQDPASTLLVSTGNNGIAGPGAHSYSYKQGTSFAAPQAAGVASLMLAVNPALSPAQLMARMQAGARTHVAGSLPACSNSQPNACTCTTDSCGAGLLDADRAVQLATGPAALIVPVGAVLPGVAITLDGRQSAAIPGASIVRYQWSQLQGPTVQNLATEGPVVNAQLSGEEAEYVFRLTVEDSTGQSGQEDVRVLAQVAASQDGGGGANSLFWGLALWLWVAAVLLPLRHSMRRDRQQP
jgi:serine protease